MYAQSRVLTIQISHTALPKPAAPSSAQLHEAPPRQVTRKLSPESHSAAFLYVFYLLVGSPVSPTFGVPVEDTFRGSQDGFQPLPLLVSICPPDPSEYKDRSGGGRGTQSTP
ncbi:hypothetical protein ILYODFUR_020936 [Ilyodon furcidens]|uniref:Uncharacterized protein n=1 Tax=Ilyodon furcidens TaxID=33524 RepID=A0ABV0UKQ4_9TELE